MSLHANPAVLHACLQRGPAFGYFGLKLPPEPVAVGPGLLSFDEEPPVGAWQSLDDPS